MKKKDLDIMKRSSLIGLIGFSLLLLGFDAQAQVPETIAYQGYLTDADGAPLDGAFDLTFRLYDAASGGAALWIETQADAVLTAGVFSTALGHVRPLSGVAFDAPLWLSVAVGDAGAEEFQPRVALGAVPYSLHARTLSEEALVAGANVTIEREGEALLISAAGADSASGWRLGGNAGTDPSVDFIGTSDETALELRVDGVRALRVEPATHPTYGFIPNMIGGYAGNRVAEGVVGGTIGGGGLGGEIDQSNVVEDHFATVGGGSLNIADGVGATVSGGGANTARGFDATVGGGQVNTADGQFATISGGGFNAASGDDTTIGGGNQNVAGAEAATVGGGRLNVANGINSFVGGGYGNSASGAVATIPGGTSNVAEGNFSFAAGSRAKALHGGAFVWADNTFEDFASTAEKQFLIRAAGGVGIGTNEPSSPLTVAGVIESTQGGIRFPDGSTQASAGWAFGGNAGTDPSVDYIGTSDETALELRVNGERALRIEPASLNEIVSPNLIGGHTGNGVAEDVVGATIAGGGGFENKNNYASHFSFIGGGSGNLAAAFGSVVGGGIGNTAGSANATIGGGLNNFAVGEQATISGGLANTTDRPFATVSGGAENSADGVSATVPGGQDNEAAGDYSFAAGQRAKALHDGAFVWADDTSADFASTAEDQFLIRATGGVGVGTNAPQAQLHVEHPDDEIDLILGGTSNTAAGDDGILSSDPNYDGSDLFFHTNDAFVIRLDHDGNGEDADFYIRDKDDNNIFEVDEDGTVTVLGTVVHSSDRNRKERIEAVDPQHLLEEVARLPLYRWSYKGEAVRHVGPMAQDFSASFEVGRDETTIATVDADGVALAAIQALHQRVQAQDRIIEALVRRLDALERQGRAEQ